MNDRSKEALGRAIAEAGGVAALARVLGITSQAVSQWRRVPADRVVQVERATGGRVKKEDLRPDIFQAAADAPEAAA